MEAGAGKPEKERWKPILSMRKMKVNRFFTNSLRTKI
jgi:hypothetical protein